MKVALVGQKGGSGKTTTALSIADEWFRRECSVLVVDLDPQATARTWADVASENEVDGPTVINMGVGFHEKLDNVAANFDVVVLDCPPGHTDIQRAALMVADVAIVPCGPGTTDVWSLAETVEVVQQAKMIRPSLVARILLTRRDARTTISSAAESALNTLSVPVLNTSLGFRVAFQEAPSSGLGVTRYAPSSKAAKEVKQLVDEIELLNKPALKVVANG